MFFLDTKTFSRKVIQGLLCMCALAITGTTPANTENTQSVHHIQQLAPLSYFFTTQKIPQDLRPRLTFINKTELSYPYRFLLTQPLMTVGIAEFYQRTPKVRDPLYVTIDTHQKTYSRAIIMIIDSQKSRDNALIADKSGNSIVVELGLITINFQALPSAVIHEITHSQTPFGALLAKNKIKTRNTELFYFRLTCNDVLAKYLQCPIGKTLYGRTNTLIREDNGQWVAHVVEILTGAKYRK